ncbi:grasp-with-spasm system SPASM domain peptide maturase [Flavobacteriaceae bacterium (ex Bugula neritina AB1)]|nr:grasp-with-spasm system SPASM domain peptide maturase [Flavobacteriaceae bacterium (ex Bugula neritina AB1)]
MIYFSFFPSCTLTKGFRNSCLMDLERASYCSIPNELYEVLKEKFNISLNKIKQTYLEEDFSVIKEYLTFLESKHFIFFHLEKQEVINDISKEQFSSSYEIEDLIIDIKSLHQFNHITKKIPANIETLQLRIFYEIPILDLYSIVEVLRVLEITNIEIIFRHNKENTENDYTSLFYDYLIISKMFVMNFEDNKHIIPNHIIALSQELISHKQCGKVSEKLFNPNLRTYLSARSCNSCLHKKISIDINGDIKNCPSLSSTFGNIKDTSLEKILKHKDFHKLWNITKDEIEICKDCEFRYICTDCRGYVEKPKNIYSKPLKCGYNPYTNVWDEWSTNPLKSQAIKYYNL